MTTLSLVNLSRVYAPGISAVSDLTLTVEQGELMVLLGPSGCGKTTTLRLVAGLLSPTRGDILFDGRPVLGIPPEKRGAVMVFQEHALFPFLSVGENVAYGLKLRGLSHGEIQERVGQALAAVQMAGFEERRPDQLSGGQRGRVALARALVIQPQVLLLDEPLGNLDRGLREELRAMIHALQRESGITTLFVTHDQDEAVALADRIGVLIDGRLRQVGSPRDLYNNPADAQVARFLGAENFLPGLKQGHVVQTPMGDIVIADSPFSDGPVLLTIRPEAIEIGAFGDNSFMACVETSSYGVPAARCEIVINGLRLHLTPPPYHDLRPGQEIMVHLSRERICVLPAENK